MAECLIASDLDFALALQLQEDAWRNNSPKKEVTTENYHVEKRTPTNGDRDFALALQLQEEAWKNDSPKKEVTTENYHVEKRTPTKVAKSLIDPEWEAIDPIPDIHGLFLDFNSSYFWGKLSGIEVKWSPRMTLCAGLCVYQGSGGLCSVRLSQPLLKFRPRKDLVETLLHEMIHAYLFVTANDRDHDAHGPEFLNHMHRINKETGAHISVYHNFHDEVEHYKTHWWLCNGPCRQRQPFYGIVKRAMNRPPGPNDWWWAQHQKECGGTYNKIKEPDDYQRKANKRKPEEASGTNSKRSKDHPTVDNFIPFIGTGQRLGDGKTPNSPFNLATQPSITRFLDSGIPKLPRTPSVGEQSTFSSTNKNSTTTSENQLTRFSPAADFSGSGSAKHSTVARDIPSTSTTPIPKRKVRPRPHGTITLSELRRTVQGTSTTTSRHLGGASGSGTNKKRSVSWKRRNGAPSPLNLSDSDEEPFEIVRKPKMVMTNEKSNVLKSKSESEWDSPEVMEIDSGSEEMNFEVKSKIDKPPETSKSVMDVDNETSKAGTSSELVTPWTLCKKASDQQKLIASLYECPICHEEIPVETINAHLDVCLLLNESK